MTFHLVDNAEDGVIGEKKLSDGIQIVKFGETSVPVKIKGDLIAVRLEQILGNRQDVVVWIASGDAGTGVDASEMPHMRSIPMDLSKFEGKRPIVAVYGLAGKNEIRHQLVEFRAKEH